MKKFAFGVILGSCVTYVALMALMDDVMVKLEGLPKPKEEG